MSEPNYEEKILDQLEDVEQQYKENNEEIKKLQVLLNKRLERGVELKGEYKALKKLLPPEEEPLSENQKE